MAAWFQAGLPRVQRSAVDEKYVGPAIVVIIKNCDATTRSLDDVLLGVAAPVHVFHAEPGLRGHVNEPSGLRVKVVGGIWRGCGCLYRNSSRRSGLLGLSGKQCDEKANDRARGIVKKSPPPAHNRIVSSARRIQLASICG